MQVLLTIGVIAVAALWLMAVVRRLEKHRTEVRLVWRKLEADQSNEAIKSVYNKHVKIYNDSLESFPASLIAPLAGFKPARRF